jgi:hypothetical protein
LIKNVHYHQKDTVFDDYIKLRLRNILKIRLCYKYDFIIVKNGTYDFSVANLTCHSGKSAAKISDKCESSSADLSGIQVKILLLSQDITWLLSKQQDNFRNYSWKIVES